MIPATESQISYLNSLCRRFLAIDPATLPAKAKSRFGTYSPRGNAQIARSLAEEAMSRIESMSRAAASTYIDTLKSQSI